jgi:hypothetical protein
MENVETEILAMQNYLNGLCEENGFSVTFDDDTLGGVLVKDGKEDDVQFEIDGDVVTANGMDIYDFFESFDAENA